MWRGKGKNVIVTSGAIHVIKHKLSSICPSPISPRVSAGPRDESNSLPPAPATTLQGPSRKPSNTGKKIPCFSTENTQKFEYGESTACLYISRHILCGAHKALYIIPQKTSTDPSEKWIIESTSPSIIRRSGRQNHVESTLKSDRSTSSI